MKARFVLALSVVLLLVGASAAQNLPVTGFFSNTVSSAPNLAPWIFAGDFNRDGIIDVAATVGCITTNCNQDEILVYLGNGDGTFHQGAAYLTARSTVSITGGDFNHDGTIDLAAASLNCQFVPCPAGKISILLGNGDGTFKSAVNVDTGEEPNFIAVADLNGDGKLDLITANNCVFNCSGSVKNALSVLLGKGDGTFQPHMDLQLDNAQYAYWVAVGDLNNDGIPDLATADYCVSSCRLLDGTMSILWGNGDGTFRPGGDYTRRGGATSIAVVDLNGDGDLDIAAPSVGDDVAIYLGNGSGTFGTPVIYPAGDSPQSITTGDFNGDGKIDLATSNYGILVYPGTASVLLGRGDGTFVEHRDYPTGIAPQAILAADFNGDGKLDLATANYNDATFSVLLQTSVKLAPTELVFPTTIVGVSSKPKAVNLANLRRTPLHISKVSFSGANPADFQLNSTCGPTLDSRKSCTVTVTFTPTLQGSRTAALVFADDDASGEQTIPIRAEAQALSIAPKAVRFGAQKVGTTSNPVPVTVTNQSSESVQVKSIAITGTNRRDFSETNNCPKFLKQEMSCTITVTFTPSIVGNESATVNIDQNGGGGLLEIPLAGSGH